MTREREYFFGEDRMARGGGGGRPGGPMGGGGGGGGGRPLRSHQVKALKETMHSAHRTGLTPKILENFAPGQTLKPGTDLTRKKPKPAATGLASYVHMFAGPQDAEEIKEPSTRNRLFRNPELQLQCRLNTETLTEKRIRLNQWKREEAAQQAADAAKAWDPHKDPKIDGDPFRTLFVARVSFDVTDKKLKREFEEYGPIKKVTMVTNTKTGKPRGYAFIEYEDKKDMKEAYKTADGKKIEGRRVLVDVERGRTVESWKPRRLAGGLGGEGRMAKPPLPKNARKRLVLPPLEDDRRGGAGGLSEAARRDAETNQQRERDRMERDRIDRERAREDRERERRDRGRGDRDRDYRDRDRDRGDRDRGERGDRDRGDRDRDRKRERDLSPRRDDDKRRRGGAVELEDGEVH